MNETLLKRIVIVLTVITFFCLIWVVGATSRKKVELDKNKGLNEQLEKLTKANTASTDDLKKTRNKLAEAKKMEQSLREALAQEELKNQSLRTNLNVTQKTYEEMQPELENLKKANASLKEELNGLKARDEIIQKEIKSIKADLKHKKQPAKEKEKKQETQTTPSVKKSNFDWKK